MNPQTITFVILGVAIVLLVSDRLRPDLIALLVVISLGVTGILTAQEAFSGFSRSAVFTILAVYILADGLERTGITDQVGKLLLRISRERGSWLGTVVMLAGAFLSLFMNNIAAASVLFPAVSGAARKSGISSARLLMPLSIGTILGGMATLFTTSNIVVSSLLKDQNLRGFGVFDFAPLGLIFVGIGVVYMIIWGQRLLPIKSPVQRLGEIGYQQSELTDIYRLEERLFQARIPDTSLLCGVSLADSNLREKYNINLVGIKRNSKVVYSPSPDFRFLGGDILLIEGRPEEISPEALQPSLTLLHDGVWDEKELGSKGMRLFEAVLAPRSNLIGQTLRSVNFREKFDMNVIAIWRAGRPIRTHLSELPLQFGDALLIQGKPDRVQILQSEPSLIVLDDIKTRVLRKPHKAWLAILIMAFTVGVAALSNLPTGEVMLFGALAMVLTGILSMDQVYQAIDWKSIFLIAGMLPLSIAMTKTGAATTIGGWLINIVGNATPLMILASLVVLTILLSQVMNGAAVATIVAPIAIGISLQNGIDPRSMAMGIAMAASMTFITPLGHAVNVLVMGPGGYRFRDFLLVGSPLTLLLFIALMVFLPMLWPLT